MMYVTFVASSNQISRSCVGWLSGASLEDTLAIFTFKNIFLVPILFSPGPYEKYPLLGWDLNPDHQSSGHTSCHGYQAEVVMPKGMYLKDPHTASDLIGLKACC